MASSFDHEDVWFLLGASTQLYVSHALILPGCVRHLIAHSLVHRWPDGPRPHHPAQLAHTSEAIEKAGFCGRVLLHMLTSGPGTLLSTTAIGQSTAALPWYIRHRSFQRFRARRPPRHRGSELCFPPPISARQKLPDNPRGLCFRPNVRR